MSNSDAIQIELVDGADKVQYLLPLAFILQYEPQVMDSVTFGLVNFPGLKKEQAGILYITFIATQPPLLLSLP